LQPVDQATLAENLVLAQRFIEEVLGGKNPNAFDELVADDIVVNTVLKPSGSIHGKAEYVDVLGSTMSGQFSERSLEVHDITPLIDGRVMARVCAHATHVGDVFGVPATHRRITMHELHLMRFRDGKLVELYVGGLNPLQFEMLFAPAISPMVLAEAA
jgi:predicted ester cyclase